MSSDVDMEKYHQDLDHLLKEFNIKLSGPKERFKRNKAAHRYKPWHRTRTRGTSR